MVQISSLVPPRMLLCALRLRKRSNGELQPVTIYMESKLVRTYDGQPAHHKVSVVISQHARLYTCTMLHTSASAMIEMIWAREIGRAW